MSPRCYRLSDWARKTSVAFTRGLTSSADCEWERFSFRKMALMCFSTARLDSSFFRVRFDRLTPREKDYLCAMAEMGTGNQRSGGVAERLGVKVQTIAPLRSSLIKKGMIYSPAHGDTAFTVPLFDQFMLRTMPDGPRKATQ